MYVKMDAMLTCRLDTMPLGEDDSTSIFPVRDRHSTAYLFFMNLTEIYGKTAKGLLFTKTRGKKLSKDLMRVFSLVDGRSTLEAMLRHPDAPSKPVLRAAIEELLAEGYIKFISGGAALNRLTVEMAHSHGMDGFSVSDANTQAFHDAQAEILARNAIRERSKSESIDLQAIIDGAIVAASSEHDEQKAEEERRLEESEKKLREQQEAEQLAREATADAARKKAEQQAKLAAEKKASQEAERQSRKEAERVVRQQAELLARQEAGEKRRRETEMRETEERARQVAEQRAREEAEARAKAEAEEQARLKAENAARLEAEKAAHAQEEAEARARQERRLAARAREEAEELARRLAEEAARQEAEQKRLHDEAEARARAEAEEQARLKAEEKARQEAELERVREATKARERAEAEERARVEAEQKRIHEEIEAKAKAEEKARQEAELARVRAEAEELARIQAEKEAELAAAKQRALEETEEQARIQAEREAELAAEQVRLQEEADARAKAEAEALALWQIEENARLEAELEDEQRRSREEAEARAQDEMEQARRKAEDEALVALEEAERKRLEAEALARREAETLAWEKSERLAREREEKSRREAAKARKTMEKQEKARARLESFERVKQSAVGMLHFLPWRRIALAAFILLVAVPLLLLHLLNLSFLVEPARNLVSERLQEPVTIGAVRASLWPSPHFRLEEVVIGEKQEIVIPAILVTPELSSLTGEFGRLKAVEIESLALTSDMLARFPLWFADSDRPSRLEFPTIDLKNASLNIRGVSLPPFDASAAFSSGGRLVDVRISDAENKVSLVLTPAENSLGIALKARDWKPPLGLDLHFSSLDVEALVDRQSLRIKLFDGLVYDGRVTADGKVRWEKDWRAEGNFKLAHVQLGKLDRALEGKMEAGGSYIFTSGELNKLFAAPLIRANFKASEGSITGIDLARAIKPEETRAVSGGETSFSDLSGVLTYANRRYHFSQVKMLAGLLRADADFTLTQEQVSGRIAVTLESRATAFHTEMTLSGTPRAPILKK